MCGIAGYCLNKNITPSTERFSRMLDAIRQRGPDDEGVCFFSRGDGTSRFYKTEKTVSSLERLPDYRDAKAAIPHDVAFVHTRYAIIDLSDGGHQPFQSADRKLTAVYNGEIYNYVELRDELSGQGVKFRTRTDTEVLVEGYRVWKENLWFRLNGFWAVVLYDAASQELVFSRDRCGVAPLYYRETPEGLFFASCLQPLLKVGQENARPDEEAVRGFIQTGFKDVEESTCYSEIKSFPAACTLTLSAHQETIADCRRQKFWDLPATPFTEHNLSFGEARDHLRKLIFSAVKLRLRADVKLAFELSGGLDSSAVVAAAAELTGSQISTYTAKIHGADEEPWARTILKKYLVDYHVLEGGEAGFAENFASFSRIMEEPYDNPNDYTHYVMLKRMKEEGVKVVVTGAGGDEVLAGYEASFWPRAYREWQRESAASFLRADWYEFCRRFKTWERSKKTLRHYLFDSARYLFKQSGCPKKEIGRKVTATPAKRYQEAYDRLSFAEQRRFHFRVALLPYYLRSSDHFTMCLPLEHRFPLLDYRIIEFGLKMPIAYLFRNGWTKYVLRKAMEPYLPPEITWRRQKMGFAFPYRVYFTHHRRVFEPWLKNVNGLCDGALEYEELIKNDPQLLWRLISTGVWMKVSHDRLVNR